MIRSRTHPRRDGQQRLSLARTRANFTELAGGEPVVPAGFEPA
jgi:hypothetical protein